MQGIKPRNDMRITAWYFAVTSNKPLTNSDNPIEFKCKRITKKQDSIELLQGRKTNSSGGFIETDSNIDFQVNGKIIFSDSAPVATTPFVRIMKDGIETKYNDEHNLGGNKFNMDRHETKVISFG